MRARSNSNVGEFVARSDPDSPEYRDRVAVPTMQALDGMPSEYRSLVNEYGYVDVYRAWRKGWSPDRIRASSKDGAFHL